MGARSMPLAFLDTARTQIISAATPGTTYAASSVLDVKGYTRVVIEVDFDAAAADDELSLIPMLSVAQGAAAGGETAPVATDDVWFVPSVDDGAVTVAEPGGTQLANVDFTLAPEFGRRTMRQLEIRFEKANNASDEIRQRFTLDVTDATFFCLLYRNVRASAGTLSAWATRAGS